MRIVTKITVMESKDDPSRLCRLGDAAILKHPSDLPDPIMVEATTEIIHGERFVDLKGREIRLGMTREVAETLGLPFEVIKSQARTIESQTSRIESQDRRIDLERRQVSRCNERLAAWQEMGLWSRVRFLFGLTPTSRCRDVSYSPTSPTSNTSPTRAVRIERWKNHYVNVFDGEAQERCVVGGVCAAGYRSVLRHARELLTTEMCLKSKPSTR